MNHNREAHGNKERGVDVLPTQYSRGLGLHEHAGLRAILQSIMQCDVPIHTCLSGLYVSWRTRNTSASSW
jgi:hypothetical protein